MDWIVVGLGNPGKKYAQTRHNIGFMVCQALAEKHNSAWTSGKGDWYESKITVSGQRVLLLLPTTYMNNSGEAVISAQRMYSVPTERIIVVVDEYNFPLGKVHLKSNGSDGGHNGLASLIFHLKSNEFLRLRCGIDKKFGQGELVEYVLAPFGNDEEAEKNTMIIKAGKAIETIIQIGTQRAMSEINSGALFREKEKSVNVNPLASKDSTPKP